MPTFIMTIVYYFQTRKTFFWVIPKICDGGANIPQAGKETDCPPCNPGQYKNGTSCAFCRPDEYSDGNDGKSLFVDW